MLKNIAKTFWVLSTLLLLTGPNLVYAQVSCSGAYCVDEPFMGPGGTNDFSSTNFSGRATVGDTALPEVGDGTTTSTSEQSLGGNTTSTDPILEVTVPETTINMGEFSPSEPSIGSTTFSVRTYLSSGYVVYSVGPPPTTTGGASIDAMSAGGVSTPGTEQFGINLVNNSSPDVGADPVQQPFGVGSVTSDYSTPNNFRYNSGDIIAQSNSSSGVTTYTISYLINVHPVLTPAGEYVFSQSIVVTSTF